MKKSRFLWRFATVAAAAAIAACSSSGKNGGPPAFAPAAPAANYLEAVARRARGGSAAVMPHPDRGTSWMSPGAASRPLLYVSDGASGDVDVFAYPKGTLVGKLTGFLDPQGMCVDPSGTVWIVNAGAADLLGYAHGGTKPVAKLDDAGQYPVDCSIDPVNGDLAVSNLADASGGPGSLSIFTGASGTPATYVDPGVYRMYSLSYDGTGQIFLDGTDAKGTYRYVKFANRRFAALRLHGAGFPRLKYPGDVEWDGTHIAVGNGTFENGAIYQTSGALIVGSTPLTTDCAFGDFYVDGARAIVPSDCLGSVNFFRYPHGGTPTKTLGGPTEPIAAVVSR